MVGSVCLACMVFSPSYRIAGHGWSRASFSSLTSSQHWKVFGAPSQLTAAIYSRCTIQRWVVSTLRQWGLWWDLWTYLIVQDFLVRLYPILYLHLAASLHFFILCTFRNFITQTQIRLNLVEFSIPPSLLLPIESHVVVQNSESSESTSHLGDLHWNCLWSSFVSAENLSINVCGGSLSMQCP